MGRISGPLLDRIDLQVRMNGVTIDEAESTTEPEDSAMVRRRVYIARRAQQKRYAGRPYYCNAQLDQAGIEEFCKMTEEAAAELRQAVEKFDISMRTYGRIRKVARTAADLAGHAVIERDDILWAIHFRNLEGHFWYDNYWV